MFGRQRKTNKISVNGRQSTESLRDEKPRGDVAPSALNSSKRSSANKIFSGDALYSVRRYYPFAIYCCALILLYMGYIFSCQRLQREEISCQIELQTLRAKSLLMSTERIKATSHDNLTKEIQRRSLELKQWNSLPAIIKTTPENNCTATNKK